MDFDHRHFFESIGWEQSLTVLEAMQAMTSAKTERITQGLVIHSARYGKGDATKNVTELLRSLVVQDTLEVRADNTSLGCTGDNDPAPNEVKELIVTYSYNGEEQIKRIHETFLLSLP
ncbi:MAG: DUF3395 domain-containing protein [Anaerolineae bacterium]|nr:DUF3395 domain-containing protein [Anaerolineae bacterium]